MGAKIFKFSEIWTRDILDPPEMSIEINHRMVRQTWYRTATNSTTIVPVRDIDTQNLNVLVSEFCEEYKCKTYEVPDIVLVFNKILWVNWATSVRFQTYDYKMMRIGIILKDTLE